MRRQVDVAHPAEDQAHPGQQAPEGDGDVPGLDHAGGDLGQQRAVEQVVGGVDEHEVGLVGRQVALQVTEREEAREPTADHDDLRTGHRWAAGVCSHSARVTFPRCAPGPATSSPSDSSVPK